MNGPQERDVLRRVVSSDGFAASVVLMLLVAAWAAIDAILRLPDNILVGPAEVLLAAQGLMSTGELPTFLSRSLTTLVGASVISLGIGLPIGFGIGMSKFLASTVETTLRFLRNISAIALLPLFVVWFGLGLSAVYAVVLYTMLVIIIYNVAGAVRAVPTKYVLVVRTLGGGTMRTVRDVYLPGSIPGIVTGVRLGISYGWRAVVGGELLLSVSGMGGLLAIGRNTNSIDIIILAMIVIGLTFVILDSMVLNNFERIALRRWGGA